MGRCGWVVAALLLAGSARAEMPSFEEFFAAVSGCRLDTQRLGAREVLHEGRPILLALPSMGAPRGILVTRFFLAPGDGEGAEDYGLVFSATLDRVASLFPELAARGNVNGRLRRLQRLSDRTGDPRTGNRTILLCQAGLGT